MSIKLFFLVSEHYREQSNCPSLANLGKESSAELSCPLPHFPLVLVIFSEFAHLFFFLLPSNLHHHLLHSQQLIWSYLAPDFSAICLCTMSQSRRRSKLGSRLGIYRKKSLCSSLLFSCFLILFFFSW